MKLILRALALFAFAAAAHAQNLSIATGGTGGVYYPLGGGMAAVLSKYVQGMQATAEVTGGSVANLQLIGTGKPYIAMTMVDAGLDAYKGQDKFNGKPVPVRTLMVMYPNRMHVVSIEGAGVTKMADLKGKRVSTGSGGGEGSQDRRLFLGRRPADRGGDRPRQYPRGQDQDDRARRSRAGDEQEIRRPVREGHHPEGHLQGNGVGQPPGHRD